MTRAKPKNVAASVHARLRQIAGELGIAHEYLLNRYAAERLLYRLSKSPHREGLVLKGASLFRVWEGPAHRPTRDIDLLGRGSAELDVSERLVQDICETPVDDDGLSFPTKTMVTTRIKEDQDYEGVRVKCTPLLGSAELNVQIDIGFGDDARTEERDYPPLLEDMPAANLHVYTRESVISEKLHAMVHLDLANSRMKDFFDVRHLAIAFDFELDELTAAVRATFVRRETAIPATVPTALTSTFAGDAAKNTQWNAFLRKAKLSAPRLSDVVAELRSFLEPVLERARSPFSGDARTWGRGGPWSDG